MQLLKRKPASDGSVSEVIINTEPTAYQRQVLGGRANDQQRIVNALVSTEDLGLFKLGLRIAECCRNSCISSRPNGMLKVQEFRCKSKLCPVCSKRRAAAVFARTLNAVKAMNNARFITLTLKHSDQPLREQCLRLRRCFAELRRSKLWKEKTKGGIYTLEIARNSKTGCWHPHLHIIADGQYIAQAMLSDQWLQVTTDSPICHVRKVHDQQAAAKYIAKYVSKSLEIKGLSDDRLREWIQEARGLRFMQAFGTLHGTKLDSRPKDRPAPETLSPIGSVEQIAESASAGDEEARELNAFILGIRTRRVSHGQPGEPLPASPGECQIADRLRSWFRMQEKIRCEQLAENSRTQWSNRPSDRPIWERQEPDDPAALGVDREAIDRSRTGVPV